VAIHSDWDWSVDAHDRQRETQKDGPDHAEHADFDRQKRGFEQKRPETGVADDAVHQRGLLGCRGNESTILGVGKGRFLGLTKSIGHHRSPESPAREDVPHFATGDDTTESGIHFISQCGITSGQGDAIGDLAEWGPVDAG
jgi:hypothetical protein